MKKNHVSVLVTIFMAAFFLGGCSYNNVYKVDLDDAGTPENIIGLSDLYEEGAKNINVVFIHGMGYHPIEKELDPKTGITYKYQNELAERLGFVEFAPIDDRVNRLKSLTLRDSRIIGGHIHRVVFSSPDNMRTLNFFTLSWGEANNHIKRTILELTDDGRFLENRNGENREKGRAPVNRKLKQFINRSFSDPAIYLGDFGSEIRYVVAQGLARIEETIEAESLDDIKTNKTVLLADSLGSAVTFDTVKTLMEFDTKESVELSDYKDPVRRFSGLTTLIFMNANQLPLIDLGNLRGPAPDESRDQWLEQYPCPSSSTDKGMPNIGGSNVPLSYGIKGFGQVRESVAKSDKSLSGGGVPTLQVVAFSDPNDPLSYILTKRYKRHCESKNTKIINVVMSNARWDWAFLLANPGKAHASGFKVNKKALDLVVRGSKKVD